MTEDSKYVRFDWAIKRILRDKANAGVLEGLITVLLGEPVIITEFLSAHNNLALLEDASKYIDVIVKSKDGEFIFTEIQLVREFVYYPRIKYGMSKVDINQKYSNQIDKAYTIIVFYLDIGIGSDYAYHGTTRFCGMNKKNSTLLLNKSNEKQFMEITASSIISPNKMNHEFILLRINNFNNEASTSIEEWMAYLKNGFISADSKTPGLQEARQKLDYMRMSREERRAYEDYMVSVYAARDVYQTAFNDGRAEGMQQYRIENAKNLNTLGIPA